LSDSLIDQSITPEYRRVIENEMKRWQEQISNCYGSGHDTSSLDLSLLKAVSFFKIPERLWLDFFNAMAMPLDSDGFKTMSDMNAYAKGAAVIPMTIFLMICLAEQTEIGTYRVDGKEDIFRYGDSLGTWSFMIHILSIAGSHISGQNPINSLLPQDIIQRHGLTNADLLTIAKTDEPNENSRAAVKEFLSIAREKGSEGLAFAREKCLELPKPRCNALAIPLSLYAAIADKIEKQNYDVFTNIPFWRPEDRSELMCNIESCQTQDNLIKFW